MRSGSSTASPPPTPTRIWPWRRRSAPAYGASNTLEPTPPVDGNAYDKKFPNRLQLPRTLSEAAARLRASKPSHELFGADFVTHFAASREWEEREFRKAITDWEMQRYFEII